MNPTPYTDDQILEAIEQALDSLTERDMIMVRPGHKWGAYWDSEKDVRLQLGKKFLEALNQEEPDPYAELKAARDAGKVIQIRSDEEPATWEDIENPVFGAAPDEYRIKPEPDPYATLKAYAKAGARIRFEDEFGWSEWVANEDWSWTQPPEDYQVHPADLHLLEVKPWTPKPGDVVQLKSGGPRMTMICASTHEGAYKCTWFANDGTLHTAHIDLACLQQA